MDDNQKFERMKHRRAMLPAVMIYIVLVVLYLIICIFFKDSICVFIGASSTMWMCFYLSALVYKWMLRGMK